MTQRMQCADMRESEKKDAPSAARRLIEASLAAQRQLVGKGITQAIPAVAESPIPVLAPRNRTPDPRERTAA